MANQEDKTSNPLLNALANFNRVGLNPTTTRVRTRDGQLFEEKRREDGTIETRFVQKEVLPTHLIEGEQGFSSRFG